jgi:hypothetical protein
MYIKCLKKTYRIHIEMAAVAAGPAAAGAGDEVLARCAEFLKIVAGDTHFTTRVADVIIHNHEGYAAMSPAEKIQHHMEKQQEILNRFVGCEKAIFNDPEVKYGIRKHLDGVTGTMSNILTSAYFTLYDRLLNSRLDIHVNALDDYITLFYLASSLTVRDGRFVMDPMEFYAMKRILARLKSMLPPDTTLFTPEWFHDYRDFLEGIHREALASYTYYRNDPSRQTLHQAIGWKGPRLPEKNRNELAAKHFLGSHSHGLYEYYPPYMNPHFTDDRIEAYLEKLPMLELLFTAPESVYPIDFLPRKPPTKPVAKNNPSTTRRKSTKRYRRGGSRTWTVKRKGSRLFAQRRQQSPLR